MPHHVSVNEICYNFIMDSIKTLRHTIHTEIEIHPELKASARRYALFLPTLKSRGLRMVARYLDKRLLGKWRGQKTTFEEIFIRRQDGTRLRLCLIRSKKETKPNATGLLWLHGGGYAFGRPEQSVSYLERFVADGHTIAVAPDYTLSIDKPYPAALDDAYLALSWLKENATTLGVRPDQLFVGGESAGGGLAAALCLLARDRGDISIAFQMLFYPMLDDRHTGKAPDNKAPGWSKKTPQYAWQLYLAGKDGLPGISAYAAPARAKDLEDLPPTGAFNGNLDMFYNETIDYLARLQQANVPVHFKTFEGGYHGFDVLQPHTSIAKEAARYLDDLYAYARACYYKAQPTLMREQKDA